MDDWVFERLRRIFKGARSGTTRSSDDPALALRDYLRWKRRGWRKGGKKFGTDHATKLNRRRFSKRKFQEALRPFRSRKRPRPVMPKLLMATRYRHATLIEGFAEDRRLKWVPPLRRITQDRTPEISISVFSFLDDPEATLQAFRQIMEGECVHVEALLHFPEGFCNDIAPYLVLAELWPAMAPVFRGGHMSQPTQKVVEAVGLRSTLGISLRGVTNLEDVWAFPLQRRRPANSSKSANRNLEAQTREKVADRFCDAVNDWLGRPEINQQLTDVGCAWIASIIGELLENAERHAQPTTKDGDWSTAAFLARRQEGDQTVYRCYMAFLSVGHTISQSLQTCSPRVADELRRYREKHAGGGGASSETLETVFALQDGVTRDPVADAHERGGFGFQEVLSFVNEIGGTRRAGHEPRVTIVSGSSCIMLKPPYFVGRRMRDETSARVIWFNPENSPHEPPDPTYVFDLTERFAGTIISIAFTLDPDYLNETVG